MKGILKGIITILIILGLVKTVQDHDLMNEANQYYNEAKSGELIRSITHPNFNNFKDLDLSYFKPSDFF
ncbi:hypothetical protein HMPREF2953_09335 [Staphylococcus sp. HMSC072E01]|uniref:hypothetical protein n=1 Tax=Staphylococcus sp. HMSC072E01 TaxID=1739457 RepID=UPI0008A21121|nr:hypothetical protein [Staphylococcus sp. HMSC072E01]OFQ09850.1 hypothetical protein HMPREF2953_09335 [Staphylococcus sp. HMSC072E01]